MTRGRIKRVKEYVGDETLYDLWNGVSDVNITELLKFHSKTGKWASVTAVQPAGRFGAIKMDGTTITSFEEKPEGDGGWINGGFFC